MLFEKKVEIYLMKGYDSMDKNEVGRIFGEVHRGASNKAALRMKMDSAAITIIFKRP